jgi:hypothetical protein
MTRPGSSIVRSAIAAMTVRLFLAQVGLAAAVFALTIVWLRLPDSSAFSVVATIVVGLLLLALASGGEIAIMLRLCNRPLTLGRILRGAIALLVCVVLWLLWSWIITSFESKGELLAGYLNSRFPASLRNTFSYAHLYQGMEWIASLLRWIGAGVLAAVVYSAAASTRPRSAARRILMSATYWAALVAGCLVASTLSSRLMDWTPGHSLSFEMLSLIFRLGLVTVVDTVIVLFVLAVISACIQRDDLPYETPGGGPESNQPLTAPVP